MKTFRRPVTAAAVALGLTVALVAPATAIDYWVDDSDLGVEAPAYPGYPDATWFTGLPTPAVAPVSTDEGLIITGRTQLMYGTAEEALTGASFEAFVQSIAVDADGEWSLQIPIFMNGSDKAGFTTLRPVAGNSTGTGPGELWTTSWGFGTYPANSTLTLAEIAAEIDNPDQSTEPVLLAVGILAYADGVETTVASISFDGDTHYFDAVPEVVEPPVEEEVVEEDPTAPAAPAAPVEAEATFAG